MAMLQERGRVVICVTFWGKGRNLVLFLPSLKYQSQVARIFSGKLRQKWYATAGTKFTKPGARFLADPCTYIHNLTSTETRKETNIDHEAFAICGAILQLEGKG